MEKQIIEGLERIKNETLLDCVVINYVEKPVSITDSKAGGLPYFPKDASYPVNDQGYPLFFLAQINFEQFPEHSLFPDKGVLQFFVDGQDDLLGVNIEDAKKADNFRVVFYENVDASLQADLPYFEMFEGYDYIEMFKDRKMIFNPKQQFISLEDYRFYPVFKQATKVSVREADSLIDDFYDQHLSCFSSYDHQVSGYPVFLHADIRTKEDDLDVLLFQAVASEDLQFAWGECGVLNFFMRKEDLKKKDFSNVCFQFDIC